MRIVPLLLVTLLLAPPAAADEMTDEERRGQVIYRTGESPSGEEIAALMGPGVEVPAAALPCGSCHGEDGRGRPEGGVEPTDVTWPSLTRSYGVRRAGGDQAPPYDEGKLRRAIALGIDSAGEELHVAMPRYRMSHEDMDALIAYMKRLGTEGAPGVSEETIRIGTLLPPEGPLDPLAEAIGGVLAAHFETAATERRLYGRTLELVSFRLPADRSAWPEAVSDFLDREEVFALVGPFFAGAEEDLVDLAVERRLPVVGPFTLHPKIERPPAAEVFYLLPGLGDQARALVGFADRLHPDEKPTAALVFPLGPDAADTVDAAREAAAESGWENLVEHSYDPGNLDALRFGSEVATFGAEVLFFLGDGADMLALLTASDHLNHHPQMLGLGSLAGRAAFQAPPGFDGKLFLAFPSLPEDHDPDAIEAYRALAEKHELPRAAGATQLTTLAAAKVLVTGIEEAGRELTRAKLIAALEQLYRHDTGLTPLITFQPNRRIGARGAYVLGVDLSSRSFERVGNWVDVGSDRRP